MTDRQQNLAFLDDVLVLAVRKSFWAAEECEVFPHRIYTRRLVPGPGRFGSSRNPANVLNVVVEGLLYCSRHKPKLILLWAPRVAGWFARLKKLGLLQDVKLVTPGAAYLEDIHARYMDKLVVFSRNEIALHDSTLEDKYEFIPLPADGPFDLVRPSRIPGDYIFSGGGAGRDFATLIEAVRGLDVPLRIVTFSPKTLGYRGELPPNCRVDWQMPVREFLELMANALFVVVPLQEGHHPHGHTTVVQAMRLGKAVITTRDASVSDYVADGQAGLLVSAGDAGEYREAILRLLDEPELRRSCEQHALARAPDLTYEAFARGITDLCRRMLASSPTSLQRQ